MRSKLIVAAMVAACSMFSGGAFAAACTASAGTISSAPSTINGDLCTLTDQLVATCGDATTIGNARDAIYQVQLGAANNPTFTVNGTGFAPYIALMNGPACNSINSCASNGENAGNAGTNVVLDPGDNLAAGTYFVFITDQSGAAAACGAFSLVTQPNLPVSLQKFSVE
jgi:hypothetical protein